MNNFVKSFVVFNLIIVFGSFSAICKTDDKKLNAIVVTVASNATDGYQQYMRSARIQGISVRALGMNRPWRGGSMAGPGGGQKVNLLRAELTQHKEERDTIVLFTDCYDVLLLAGLDDIVERFLATGARVLFGAESSCWPDKTLASKYPAVSRGKQYLNSGAFIGYAADVFAVLNYHEIDDTEDDQLYYTKVFLDVAMREKHKIQLDHRSIIFQNLHGAAEEIDVEWKNGEPFIINKVFNTQPAVLHGNGPSKVTFNSLANYLARAWTSPEGCIACKEDLIQLDEAKMTSWPRVLLAVFISKPTPFMEEFVTTLKKLEYPRARLDLFVYNAVEKHEPAVEALLEALKEVRSIKRIKPEDSVAETHARTLAGEYFMRKKCDLYFNIDSDARLDNPHTLKLLIEQNRGVIAPLLVRPYKAWSNFWGAMTDDGYYARSVDYMDIVNNNKRGLWNVPYISACYLVNGTVVNNPNTRPSFVSGSLDQDMAFSFNMRAKGVFMYVSNRVDFGHLLDLEEFSLDHLHPELHNIFYNQWDWEQRYLHENYSQNLDLEQKPLQPCPDVFWFPVASPRFCTELIATMENFGKWSDGSNKDERLGGGYEAVPTRDIHMNQVGLEKAWLHFLKLYVLPLNQRVFQGYQDSAPKSIMNFVVRYRPDEQPSLRPHHDSSTYTINIALNTPHLDYEGGGCRFIRYNCSVTNMRLGWMLMHPGRLTHIHEGLRVTNGTRYIMISFIDP